MSDSHSVTLMIEQLRRSKDARDPAAAQIWSRYATMLFRAAYRQLSDAIRVQADPDSILQDSHASFHRLIVSGKLQVKNRNTLVAALVDITVKNAQDAARKETTLKRDAGRRIGQGRDDSMSPLDTARSGEAPPEEAAMFLDNLNRGMAVLDPFLRSIVTMKLEGLSNRAIASRLPSSIRKVQRKLQLIMTIWAKHGLLPEGYMPDDVDDEPEDGDE